MAQDMKQISETVHSPGTQLRHITFKQDPPISVSLEFVGMFISRALEKIASEKETKKSSNSDLRDACYAGIAFLKTRVDLSGSGKTDPGAHMPPSQSQGGALLNDEQLLIPFELACKSKSPKVVAISLDCLQKLIAYGHVPNNALESSGNVRLIERIVRTICACFHGVTTDEGVQLQVIKALLTVVTSPIVEVHEKDILLVVQTCYSIYMATRNLVNQTTARATLTQMLNVIFQRMEQATVEQAAVENDRNPGANESLKSSSSSALLSQHENGVPATEQQKSEKSSSRASSQENLRKDSVNEEEGEKDESESASKEYGVVDQNGEEDTASECKDTSVSEEPYEEDQRPSSSVENGNTEQPNRDDAAQKETRDDQENQDEQKCTKAEIVDSEEEPTTPKSEVPTPTPFHRSPSSVMAESDSVVASATDSADEGASPNFYFAHASQKDAFLVLRSLCRLAMKPLANTNPADPRSHELRSKIFSLQLLFSVLQDPGTAFRSNEIFITAIKQYLCVALSVNGVSIVPEVFELSLSIFLALLTHFKQHLKNQIEVFFKDVLLAVLESTTMPFEYKWIVVEALQRICMDKQGIVDAYLNYDCDLERANIFERLVIGLSKVAQGRHSVDTKASPVQLQNLRKKGLECLVLILKCMVRWSNDLFNVSNETQSFLGSEPGVSTANASHDMDADSNSSVGMNKPLSDDPEAFESRKAQKEVYESGIHLFNRGKIATGLTILQDNNLLGTSAEDVALFLHNESRLCRTAIGDFLGQNEAFPLEVMYAYVDCFDFFGVEFVSALRLFLSGFRLPGEAQKIDRLMEKFAARYYACNHNETVFASADTAYVLAYSIIMLTTDLHSVKIKEKQRMSKEAYIKMNRGINDSQDLPREYLGQIYDEIAQCEIQMRAGGGSTTMAANGGTSVSSTTANGMAAGVRDLMESVSHMQSEFTSATHFEHVRPMFKLVWTPFLAAFSVGLQDCDDLMVAHHCLEGIQCAIRIACIFRMELERDAYVQALARFTLLLSTSQQQHHHHNSVSGASSSAATMRSRADSTQTHATNGGLNQSASSPALHTAVGGGGVTTPSSAVSSLVNPATETMKSKNVDSIRTLISVAQTDGNYLGHSWLHILRCISQLESANVISTNTVRSLPPRQRQTSANGGTAAVSPSQATPAVSTTTADGGVDGEGGDSLSRTTRGSNAINGIKRGISTLSPGSLAAATVDSRKAAVLQEVMCETGSHSVVVAVDKIFSGSVRLDGDAIVDFVKALCQVSLEELSLPQPRTFSLQKVVEISYYNIGRIRLQWSRVWEHIGQHFTRAGRSTNEDVALFTVDSLRQLCVKLIEKGELPNFHFQKEFLRPFLSILNVKDVSPSVQDMVVRCVSQLIQSQWTNVRSGWSNIFLALYLAASLPDEAVVELAFDSCSFIINNIIPNSFYILAESFPVFIKALAEFACNLRFPEISMEAIRLIRQCARVVGERTTQFDTTEDSATTTTAVSNKVSANTTTAAAPSSTVNERAQKESRENQEEDGAITKKDTQHQAAVEEEDALSSALWSRGWMPILYELFRVINNCKLDVRTRGLTVFFEIIKTYGDTFHLSWWVQIFKLIFSIFEHGRDTASDTASPLGISTTATTPSTTTSPSTIQQQQGRLTRQRLVSGGDTLLDSFSITYRVFVSATDRSEWLNTTCNHSLYSVVDIFSQFFVQIGSVLLASLYEQLKWCCLQDHEQLARSGTSCLETIVLTNGKKFKEQEWNMTVNLLVDLFKTTLPHQLLTWRPDPAVEGSSADEATARRRHSARTRLFLRLLINCIVQFELIQTVDNILFYSSRSRHEDAVLLQAARRSSAKLNSALIQSSARQRSIPPSSTAAPSNGSPQTPRTPEEKRILDAVTAGVGTASSDNNNNNGNGTGLSGDSFSIVSDVNGDNEELVNGELPLDNRAIYPYVSFENRLALVNCLLESHKFAKTFNSDLEQRNILWEAGFKAKAKPNLLKQETNSLCTTIRILFRLSAEEHEAQDKVTALLEETIDEGLAYYRRLPLDGHRQAWDGCILLILTRLVQIRSESMFRRLANRLYPCFCDLVGLPNLAPEVSVLLRTLLMRARDS